MGRKYQCILFSEGSSSEWPFQTRLIVRAQRKHVITGSPSSLQPRFLAGISHPYTKAFEQGPAQHTSFIEGNSSRAPHPHTKTPWRRQRYCYHLPVRKWRLREVKWPPRVTQLDGNQGRLASHTLLLTALPYPYNQQQADYKHNYVGQKIWTSTRKYKRRNVSPRIIPLQQALLTEGKILEHRYLAHKLWL